MTSARTHSPPSMGPTGSPIQFYVLNELERRLSRGGLVPADHGQTAANNIEHILPRTLSRTPLERMVRVAGSR